MKESRNSVHTAKTAKTSSAIEIPPCPFCNGKAKHTVGKMHDPGAVWCTKCSARIEKSRLDHAIAAWRRRMGG